MLRQGYCKSSKLHQENKLANQRNKTSVPQTQKFKFQILTEVLKKNQTWCGFPCCWTKKPNTFSTARRDAADLSKNCEAPKIDSFEVWTASTGIKETFTGPVAGHSWKLEKLLERKCRWSRFWFGHTIAAQIWQTLLEVVVIYHQSTRF